MTEISRQFGATKIVPKTGQTTSYAIGQIVSVAINVAGSGYSVDDIVQIDDGNFDAQVRIADVNAGVPQIVSIESIGTGYSDASDVATSYGGAGSGLTLDITAVNGGDDGDLQVGNVANPRYVDNGDGTVSDRATGLMWYQDGSDLGAMTWYEAVDKCNRLSFAGYTDWRLPNINELVSLFQWTNWPCIDPIFTNITNDVYWSSTVFPQEDSEVFVIFYGDLGYGITAYGKTSGQNLLAVRGGR